MWKFRFSPDLQSAHSGAPVPAGRTDHGDTAHETGKAARSAATVAARAVLILLLCAFVPVILIAFFMGVTALLRGEFSTAVLAFVAVGFLIWYLRGPLGGFWEVGNEGRPRSDRRERPAGDERTGGQERSGGHEGPGLDERTGGRPGGEEWKPTGEPTSAPPGGAAAEPVPRLSLPEEFLLLAHTRYGLVYRHDQAAIGCAAAELGELALRRRLGVVARNARPYGSRASSGDVHVHVLDRTPTGLAWGDEVLAELDHRSVLPGDPAAGPAPEASPTRPVSLQEWLRLRGDRAFLRHREALIERGLLVHSPGCHEGQEGHHYADVGARNALIDRLRSVSGGRAVLDGHLLFLLDLVAESGLDAELGLTMSLAWRHDRARGSGAMAAVPKEMRDTGTLLFGGVFAKARRPISSGIGWEAGGDGDGGGGE